MHRRVAGKCGPDTAAPRPPHTARTRIPGWTPCGRFSTFRSGAFLASAARHVNVRTAARWGAWLLGAFACVAAAVTPAQAADVSDARLATKHDYTRITIESKGGPLDYKVFTVPDPKRLVLDLEAPHAYKEIESLSAQLPDDDPLIEAVRVGRFKPGVVRVVFDLRAAVKPESYRLAPVADFGDRLVLDVYPAAGADPVQALLADLDAKSGGNPPAKGGNAQAARPAVADVKQAAASPPAAPDPADMERLITVAIDAGHGGEDPGARGHRGTLEKDVTLAVARKLKEAIDAQPNMRGVLTRDGDYFIPLHQRVVKARAVQADLFVSIHADAFIKPNAQGSSVFALSERGATSAAARWLAKRENDADLIGGVNLDVPDPNLKKVLLDLSQTATINDSLKLGRAVLARIGTINTLHKHRVEQAGFAVLKAPDIPSILVETAFISNPREEKRLNDDAYQTKLANAITSGIKAYFAKNPPLARMRTVRSDTPGVDDHGRRGAIGDGLQLVAYPASTSEGGAGTNDARPDKALKHQAPRAKKKVHRHRPATARRVKASGRKARHHRVARKSTHRTCRKVATSKKASARCRVRHAGAHHRHHRKH
ncbi:MAG: AMIN domain-containing protein [Betaproteobacteria bacterium]|nr:AMIN domain-containing protein [Betaproteobacteria bacterium]